MRTQSQRYAILQALGIDTYVLRKGNVSSLIRSPRLVIAYESSLSLRTQPLIADLVRSLQLHPEEIAWVHVKEGVWPSLPVSKNWLVLGEHLAQSLREKLATVQSSTSFAISVATYPEKICCDNIHKRSLWQTVKLLLRELYQ